MTVTLSGIVGFFSIHGVVRNLLYSAKIDWLLGFEVGLVYILGRTRWENGGAFNMSYTACNVCGSEESKLVIVENNWTVVECNNCGLIYVNPQPTKEQITNLYIDAPRNRFPPPLSGKTLTKLLGFIGKSLEKGTLLDVGCGNGHFLGVAKELGWVVQGLEVDEVAAEKASKELQVQVHPGDAHNLTKHPHINGKFNLVTMWHVLEHLIDPSSVVTQIYEVLDKGGLSVIAVPNMTFHLFRIKFLPWIGSRGEQTRLLDAPGHLYGFNPRTVKLLLTKAGFSEIGVFTGEPSKLGKAHTRFLRKLLYLLAKVIFHLTVGKVILSSSMLVIARK